MRIEAFVEPDAIGLRLYEGESLRVERRLTPAPTECADRRAALGLALALAIDAAVLEAFAPEPAAPRVEPQPPTPVQPPPTDVEPPPVVAEEPRVSGAIAIEALGGFAVLPAPAFGAAVTGEVLPVPWLAVQAGAFALVGLRFPLGEGSVAPLVAAGSVGVCPGRAFGRRVRLSLCG